MEQQIFVSDYEAEVLTEMLKSEVTLYYDNSFAPVTSRMVELGLVDILDSDYGVNVNLTGAGRIFGLHLNERIYKNRVGQVEVINEKWRQVNKWKRRLNNRN